MPFLENIAKLRLFLAKPKTPLVPYLSIQGRITTDTTSQISQLLNKLPKSSKKLAVVINSSSGQPSQAYIISQKLKQKTKELDIELITFAEEFALNCGFFLLAQGNRVYADRTTYIGGVEVGKGKNSLGVFSRYLDTVVYSQGVTYMGELKKQGAFDQGKAEEMRELFTYFSENMKQRILSTRKNLQNPAQFDFTKLYNGEQAAKIGLIDGVGRIHETLPRLLPNPRISAMYPSQIKKMVNTLRKINLKT